MSLPSSDIPIFGHVGPNFERVRQTFLQNFRERNELGAAVAVYLDGLPIVDLWGGYVDTVRKQPWQRDTIVCMKSVAKGMTALCAHMLIDRGLLDPEVPVVTYWPEFASASGKDTITVKHVLSHTAALMFLDHANPGDCFHWDAMVRALELQAPEWPPGTKGAYHTATYGHLVGEIIRRISSKTPGRFFRDEVAEPLNIDYHIGIYSKVSRVTDLLRDPNDRFVLDDPKKAARAFKAFPADRDITNEDAFRRVEFPSSNGIGNARAIARVFAALARGGELDGIRLLKPKTLTQATTEQWNYSDGLWGVPMRCALGFLLQRPDAMPIGPNPNSFGSPGAGGSVGFADPDLRLSFAYCPNLMWPTISIGDRCKALIDAVYASLS